MPDTFAERLRNIRKAQGLKQYQLADRAGVDKAMICRYEKGKEFPSFCSLEWICKALGVPASQLLGF